MEYSTDSFNKALIFAAKAHGCQKIDRSEIPYIIHPVMVAWELISFIDYFSEEDPKLLIQTALLHDVLEDTFTTRTSLHDEFGEETELIVFLLSKEIKAEGTKKTQEEYFNELSEGPRTAQIVKMADRIVNLNPPPAHWNQERIAEYYEESQKILHRLGLANQSMADRLKQKIAQYKAYFDESDHR
jgi:(p)ppGpp synthase/HD superfamily hydrolase